MWWSKLIVVWAVDALSIDRSIDADSGYASAVSDGSLVYLLPHEATSIGIVDPSQAQYRRVDLPITTKQYRGGCIVGSVVHLAPYAASAPTFEWSLGNETFGPPLSSKAKAFVGCVSFGESVVFVPGFADEIIVSLRGVLTANLTADDAEDQKYASGVADDTFVYLVPYTATAVLVLDVEKAIVHRRILAASSFAGGAAFWRNSLVFAPSSGLLALFDLSEGRWNERNLNVTASAILVYEDLALLSSRDALIIVNLTSDELVATTASRDDVVFPFSGGVLLNDVAFVAPHHATTIGRVFFTSSPSGDIILDDPSSSSKTRRRIPWRRATTTTRHKVYAVVYMILVLVAASILAMHLYTKSSLLEKEEDDDDDDDDDANGGIRRRMGILLVVFGWIDLGSASLFVAELWVTDSLLAIPASVGLLSATSVAVACVLVVMPEDGVVAGLGDLESYLPWHRDDKWLLPLAAVVVSRNGVGGLAAIIRLTESLDVAALGAFCIHVLALVRSFGNRTQNLRILDACFDLLAPSSSSEEDKRRRHQRPTPVRSPRVRYTSPRHLDEEYKNDPPPPEAVNSPPPPPPPDESPPPSSCSSESPPSDDGLPLTQNFLVYVTPPRFRKSGQFLRRSSDLGSIPECDESDDLVSNGEIDDLDDFGDGDESP